MLRVTVENIYRNFTVAAAFEGPAPGITVLFGPSGSGKSTVLNAVAGLLRPRHLDVELNGAKLQSLPPHKRGIGLVFQDGRLFPHMNVRDNLSYGLKRAPPPQGSGGQIYVDEVLALLALEPLLKRRPATLSGGERQRVAIGRALLGQPRLLLMDEPLASLDSPRRREIMPFLLKLRDALRMPMVYVTHALDELQQLADHVVLMESGRVLASGPLSDIAARVDLPLAARDDAAGILNGYLHSHEHERRLSAVACAGQVYLVQKQSIDPGTAVRLRIPAREVILALDAPREISVNNVIPAVVHAIGQEERTHSALVELDVGGGTILSRITLDAAERLRLRPGSKVLAFIKSVSVEVF
jgi:molybdate transport system ATP-binding protein